MLVPIDRLLPPWDVGLSLGALLLTAILVAAASQRGGDIWAPPQRSKRPAEQSAEEGATPSALRCYRMRRRADAVNAVGEDVGGGSGAVALEVGGGEVPQQLARLLRLGRNPVWGAILGTSARAIGGCGGAVRIEPRMNTDGHFPALVEKALRAAKDRGMELEVVFVARGHYGAD